MKRMPPEKRIKSLLSRLETQEQWDEVKSNVSKYYQKWTQTFKIGEKVYFYYNHDFYGGVIKKLNPKRAKVQIYVGAKNAEWSVPYQILHHARKEEELKIAVGKLSE